MRDIPQKPENHRFAPIKFFYFAFLIYIIDNIIYQLYYVTRTPANESAVYWSRDTDGNHVTSILQSALPLAEVLVT